MNQPSEMDILDSTRRNQKLHSDKQENLERFLKFLFDIAPFYIGRSI